MNILRNRFLATSSMLHNSAENLSAAVEEVQDEAEARAREQAERAIEDAQARVAAAQEMAQQVTDAAMQTELGRQIASCQEAITKCQTDLNLQANSLQAIQASMAEILMRLPLVPSSSTPPILEGEEAPQEGTGEEPAKPQGVDPAQASGEAVHRAAVEPDRERRKPMRRKV